MGAFKSSFARKSAVEFAKSAKREIVDSIHDSADDG